jgi:hypothetical protein
MILDMFLDLISGLYKTLIEAVFSPFKEAISTFIATPEKLGEFTFIDVILGRTLTVGFGLLILIALWQVFKIFFSYMGFECEEPIKVAAKVILFGFLIFYSKTLVYVVLEIFENCIDFVWKAWGNGDIQNSTAVLSETITGFIFNLTGAMTLIQMILVLYMAWKFIKLIFRFAERLVLCALLIMTAPLAFAAGCSKATDGFLKGWVKLFAGNLLIQLVQIAMFISIVIYIGTQASLTDIYAYAVIIAMIRILEKLEDIMRDISMHVGVSANMGSALRSIAGAAQSTRLVINTIRGISR